MTQDYIFSKYKMILWLILSVGLLTTITGVPVDQGSQDQGTHFWEDDLADYFQTLIEDLDYDGGALGVLKNGRMVFAQGYGIIGDREVHPSTIMPISSISKTLTAVAILQLAEQGYVGLEDEVFGDDGILSFIKPVEGLPSDPRIRDITVDHLLRHAAGWMETHAPVYDPMMNEVYLERGHNEVVNIARAMNMEGMLTQYDLIRFMITTPLAFTPGTRSSYSNFGYCVLGRVIEEVTGMAYDQYVTKHILVPAGMTHTRIGPRFEDKDITLQYDDDDIINSQYINSIVDPEFLDSTLGWYSNIYDVSRFVGCLLGYNGCHLLRHDSVHYMMEKPPLDDLIHNKQWEGIGLVTTQEGAIWQDSYKHDNDVIFFHKGDRRSKLFQNLALDYYNQGNNVTIVAMMSSNRHKRLHKDVEKMYNMVINWPESSMRDLITEDLADVVLDTNGTEVLFRYDLSEHHIESYLNSLKLAGYYPTWINAYTWDGVTNFLIISQQATNKEDLEFQTVLSHNVKKVYKQAADWEEEGYHVAMVESYTSHSHQKDNVHLVLLRRTVGVTPDDVLWNINVPLAEYNLDMEDAIKHEFSIMMQSMEHHNKKTYVSYTFHKAKGPFVTFHDLTHDRLEEIIKSNSLEDYHLEYLDAFKDGKAPMFSAVFRKSPYKKWALQTDIEPSNLDEQIVMWHKTGYIPKLIVGYETKQRTNKFIGFFIKP